MAQKRMIDKKISVSEQVANLPVPAQLIFTWSIVHADDLGLLPHSERTLRAMIVPMLDMRLEDFGVHLEAIINQGLISEFEYQGEKYYRLVKFNGHQTLKKDRQPQTVLPIEHCANPKDTWAKLNELGFQLEDDGIQLEPEVKRSEVKRREEKYTGIAFEKFWEIYPNRVNKKKSEEKWMRLPVNIQELILKDVAKRKESPPWRKDGGKFIPHPTTYLNGERWNDEIETKVPQVLSRKI